MAEKRKHSTCILTCERIAKHADGESTGLHMSRKIEQVPHRRYWSTVFSCRCPRCREAKLFRQKQTFRFRRNLDMHANCPLCNQPTDIEVGFYYGTGYVSYVIALLITIASFLAWF